MERSVNQILLKRQTKVQLFCVRVESLMLCVTVKEEDIIKRRRLVRNLSHVKCTKAINNFRVCS